MITKRNLIYGTTAAVVLTAVHWIKSYEVMTYVDIEEIAPDRGWRCYKSVVPVKYKLVRKDADFFRNIEKGNHDA